jgi:hypothetical protein
VAIAKQNATKRNFFDWHRTCDLVLPFGARVRKELIELPEVVFDELPNRVEGVVLSVTLVLVGVTFSSAMSTPDMRIWNIYAITKRKVLHRIRVLRGGELEIDLTAVRHPDVVLPHRHQAPTMSWR